MRDKLINLLSTAGWNLYTSEQAKQEIADHLIRNGVTIPVRCKDCVHSFVRYGENETYCGHPDGLNDRLRPDDFCSYGERNDND